MRVIVILAVVATAGIVAFLIWRRRNDAEGGEKGKGFRPRLGFTMLDGMGSLALLLNNGSEDDIWVEEFEFWLHGLVAEDQTAEPSNHGVRKVRQPVGPDDMLPVSLSEAIYKASGDPQREYTCVMTSVLRYRIGEESFEKPMLNYRIHMNGLTADNIHRERGPVPPVQRTMTPPDVPAVAQK